MINFAKWRRFHAILRDVLRHRPPDISECRNLGVQAYLEQQLHAISLSTFVDEQLESRSHKLAAEEEIMREAKIPELMAVGMK